MSANDWTPERIAEARAMHAATTLPAWSTMGGRCNPDPCEALLFEAKGGTEIATFWPDREQANAEFCAWAHENVPSMLAEIERLKSEVARVQGMRELAETQRNNLRHAYAALWQTASILVKSRARFTGDMFYQVSVEALDALREVVDGSDV